MATSSGSITSTGIGSGLDATSIMSKLMSLEAQPLNRLRGQADVFNSKLSNIGKLQAHMAALRDKANALVAPTLWTGTKAQVSDAAALKVGTGSATPPGSYSVQVNRLASGQTVASNPFTSASTAPGAGSLTIDIGSYDADNVFSAKAGSTALTIDVGAADSLAAIRDKINNAGTAVVAGIVNDANGARLTLRSRDTGAENAFRVTTSETSDDGVAATGLSALAYDAGQPDSPMRRTATAANAEVSINGIDVSSPGNTLDNVVDGLSLTLTKAGPAPVVVDVANDTESIKTAITEFVTAFNTAASFIRAQTAYNAESKTGGPLQSDQGVLALQSQLRGVINEASSASGAFARLSDIGIVLRTDGTLETKTTQFNAAMGNLAETRKLLTEDGASSTDSGFARRFKRLADAALGVQGVFDARTSSLRQQLDRNGKSQDKMQDRLDAVQARLQRQYTALDTTMAQLNTLSSYMSQQIAALNKA
jgi:flagellar hook-associated protein 2